MPAQSASMLQPQLGVPVQVPAWQVSPCVQLLPSSQVAVSSPGAGTQPKVASHANGQALPVPQPSVPDDVQAPLTQRSPKVQTLPSSQVVPSANA